MKAHINWHSYS